MTIAPIARLLVGLLACGPTLAPYAARAADPDPVDPVVPVDAGPDILPSLRLGIGTGIYLPSGGDSVAGFELDVNAGARVTYPSGVLVWPELGYTHSNTVFGGDRATLGVGLLYGSQNFKVGWIPRFVVGSVGDETGVGVRNSLAILGFQFLSAEVAHEWLSVDGQPSNEIRITVALDLVGVLGLVLVAPLFGFSSR